VTDQRQTSEVFHVSLDTNSTRVIQR